jgi:hypothetical protein
VPTAPQCKYITSQVDCQRERESTRGSPTLFRLAND